MENLKTSSDVLFILLGAILVLAMHGGFAFLELGTVRRKNQVNALVKILSDFSLSTIAYFFMASASLTAWTSCPVRTPWRRRAVMSSPASSSC